MYWLHKITIDARKRVQPIRTERHIAKEIKHITSSAKQLSTTRYALEGTAHKITSLCPFLHQIIKLVYIKKKLKMQTFLKQFSIFLGNFKFYSFFE